jgi:drug/metabolite transporter (DMT)-like permease
MLNLSLSILFTVGIVITFRYAHKFQADILQTLTFNYFTCILLGNLVHRDFTYLQAFWRFDWFPVAVLLGSFFIFSFFLFGYSTLKNGVSATIIANKLSLVIPVAGGFLLFGDAANAMLIAGMIAAVVAVVLTSLQHDDGNRVTTWQSLLLVFAVFIASGIVDLGLKYMEHHYYESPQFTATPVFLYGCSFLLGTIAVAYRRIASGIRLQRAAMGMGMLLGICNYTSLWFFWKALHQPGYEVSWVLPVNNIAVMILAVIAAILLFRERISRLNAMGLALAVLAMAVLVASTFY